MPRIVFTDYDTNREGSIADLIYNPNTNLNPSTGAINISIGTSVDYWKRNDWVNSIKMIRQVMREVGALDATPGAAVTGVLDTRDPVKTKVRIGTTLESVTATDFDACICVGANSNLGTIGPMDTLVTVALNELSKQLMDENA